MEYLGIIFLLVAEAVMVIAVFSISIIFEVNKYRLPISFFFNFLPFGTWVNWLINFMLQLTSMACAAIVFSAYISTILLIFDHSCWSIDVVIVLLKKLDRIEGESGSKVQNDLIKKRLENIYKMHLNAMNWMEEVQETIQLNFLVEFSIFSLLICLCIYTIADEPFSFGYVNQLLIALLSNLFVNCLMGTRVVLKIEELRAAVYDVVWYEYDSKNRKIVTLMLLASQKMEGFNGIFWPIGMETFQQVKLKAFKMLLFIW